MARPYGPYLGGQGVGATRSEPDVRYQTSDVRKIDGSGQQAVCRKQPGQCKVLSEEAKGERQRDYRLQEYGPIGRKQQATQNPELTADR